MFSHGLLSQASLAKIKIHWLIHSQFHFPVNSTWEIHASSAVCVSRTLVVDKNRILCQDKTYHCNVRCNSSFDCEQMMLAALMLSRKSVCCCAMSSMYSDAFSHSGTLLLILSNTIAFVSTPYSIIIVMRSTSCTSEAHMCAVLLNSCPCVHPSLK